MSYLQKSSLLFFIPLIIFLAFLGVHRESLANPPGALESYQRFSLSHVFWPLGDEAVRLLDFHSRKAERSICTRDIREGESTDCGSALLAVRLCYIVLLLAVTLLVSKKISPVPLGPGGTAALVCVYLIFFPNSFFYRLTSPWFLMPLLLPIALHPIGCWFFYLGLTAGAFWVWELFAVARFAGGEVPQSLLQAFGIGTRNFQDETALTLGLILFVVLLFQDEWLTVRQRFFAALVLCGACVFRGAEPLFVSFLAILAGVYVERRGEHSAYDKAISERRDLWCYGLFTRFQSLLLIALLTLSGATALLSLPPAAPGYLAELKQPMAQLRTRYKERGEVPRIFHDVNDADEILLIGERIFLADKILLQDPLPSADADPLHSELFKDYETIRYVRENWFEKLQAYHINVVLVRRDTALAELLINLHGWQIFAETKPVPEIVRTLPKESTYILLAGINVNGQVW